MMKDYELANFQACLLDALHEHVDAIDIIAHISANPACLPFKNYIDTFEAEMLEVAALLVKKWCVRADENSPVDLQKMPH